MASPDRHYYHPGTCEATEWGKRYGKNLTPKLFDDAEHEWHLAKDKNWGPWGCCNGAANSRGCQYRDQVPPPPPKPMKPRPMKPVEGEKYIRFLVGGNVCKVIGEQKNCWCLDSGRIAKKKTEGKVWVWTTDEASSLATLLSTKLSV